MYWAAAGFVDVDPESTKFSVSVYDSPLPKPTSSLSITLSPFRRPSNEYAPTDAKAACHYPNSARAIRDAKARGFDNAVMLDPLGHVAELTTANIWCAKNGALTFRDQQFPFKRANSAADLTRGDNHNVQDTARSLDDLANRVVGTYTPRGSTARRR